MIGDAQWEALRDAAVLARTNAHAPYSNFPVGAAILANGRIFAGCNVENASYPVGTCAERGAICAAVAQGCKDFEGVVVVAGPLTPPCGMCRQAIAEFNQRVPVRLYSLDDQRDTIATLDLYLPNPFLG